MESPKNDTRDLIRMNFFHAAGEPLFEARSGFNDGCGFLRAHGLALPFVDCSVSGENVCAGDEFFFKQRLTDFACLDAVFKGDVTNGIVFHSEYIGKMIDWGQRDGLTL